jgi:hypothetical protein
MINFKIFNMKKIVLTVLTVGVLSLNFTHATTNNHYDYLGGLENKENLDLSNSALGEDPRVSVVAGLVVVAVSLLTSAVWTGAGGTNPKDINKAYDLD